MPNARLTPERLVLAFLVVIILWKGGKALDAVWLFALLSGATILLSGSARSRAVPQLFLVTMVGLLVWTVLSFILSTTLNYGFDEVLQTGSLTLLTIWAAARQQEDTFFSGRYAQAVAFAGLLACGIGVAVYVLQPVDRFVGTFFDFRFHTDYWPNAWAEFLLLLWPLMLWVVYTRNEKKVPAFLRSDSGKGIILGFVLGCLLLSYSRGGFIAFAGQIVLLILLAALFKRRAVQWKRVPVVFATTVLTSIIVFTGVNAFREKFYDVESVIRKATFSAAEGTSSVTERRDFWEQATELSSSKPLFGWGPYSFRFLQPHIQKGVLETSDHPHNVFLKYAAERGIPAAILFAIVIAYALLMGLQTVIRRREEIPLELFLVVAVAGVMAHNLIDYNLQFVGIALPMWLGIGVLVSRSSPRKTANWRRKIEVILAIALLLFTMFEGINLALSSRARRSEAQGNPLEALTWYALTDRSLFPRDAWLARGAMLLALNQLPEAEQAVDRSLGYNEQDGRAWRLLGDIYLRWNKRNDALRAYEKAYEYARLDDIGITRGLVYLMREQDPVALRSRRHEFDELLNEFGLAIEQNTHFIALGRNVEDLVALADILAEMYPEEADAYRRLARRSQIHANEERAKTASRPRGLLW